MQIFGILTQKINFIFFIYLYKLERKGKSLVWTLYGSVSDYSEEDVNKRLEELLRVYGGHSAHNMGEVFEGKINMIYLYETFPL